MELDLGQGRSLFTDMNVKKKKKYLQKHTAAQRGYCQELRGGNTPSSSSSSSFLNIKHTNINTHSQTHTYRAKSSPAVVI